MPVNSDHIDGAAGGPKRPSHGLRAVTALAFAGVLTAPLVGVAAAQTGSLGSSGPGDSPAPTTSTTSSAPTTSPTTPVPTPSVATVELRVLVLDDGDPMVEAIADRLVKEGVKIDRMPVAAGSRPAITRDMLADDASSTAHYMGIVTPDIARVGLTDAENAAIDEYTADYGVREVIAYDWPTAAVGLGEPVESATVDGRAVTLTSDALAGDWSYLDGPLVLDDVDPEVGESYGYAATPIAPPADGSSFQPVLTTATASGPGVLMGVHESGGRERLMMTIGMNRYQQHFKVLSHGIVSWLTRGVSTSLYRNTFNVQIDDVFLADDEWSAEGNCTIGDGCDPEEYPDTAPGASSRMNAGDVDVLTGWQDANGIKLDMTFNAAGATAGDPLTAALLASKDDLRWLNHTWNHDNLGCEQDESVDPWQCAQPITWYPGTGPGTGTATGNTIETQISRNVDWARENDVPLDPTELVTGEHSGLKSLPNVPQDNPGLAAALAATGVEWIASDASREPEQRAVGDALTVPRHPMNIFYNTSTKANAIDEYNWIYTDTDVGGSGLCQAANSTCIEPLHPVEGFDDYIAPLEARNALGHALDVDPRPHYAHQSNLTNDRILYPVLDRLVGDYHDLFSDSAPLLNPAHAELGREMARRAAWTDAADQVTATVTGNRLVLTNSGSAPVEVPVTTFAGTDLPGSQDRDYAGARNGWVTVPASQSVTIALGRDVGFRTPDETDGTTVVAPRTQSRAANTRAVQPGTVEIPPLNEATRVGPVAVTDRSNG